MASEASGSGKDCRHGPLHLHQIPWFLAQMSPARQAMKQMLSVLRCGWWQMPGFLGGERICCLGRLWLFWRVEIPWEVGELGGEGPCCCRGVRWPDRSIFWQLTTLTWSCSVDFSSWVPVGDLALQPTLQQRSLLALLTPQGSLTGAHQHPSITHTRESLPPEILYPTSDNRPWQTTGIPETKSKAFELSSLLLVAHSEIWAECGVFTHWMGVKLPLCAPQSH